MPNPPLSVDRAIIAAAVVLTAVLFLPSAADPINVVKVSALALCAIALLALAAFRLVRTRVATVPAGPAGIAGIVLLVAFVVATVTAPVTTTAVLGAYGRNSGLLAYASVLVLFLVGLRVFERRSAHVPLVALIAAGLFTASYGLLQYVGVDAIAWANPFNPIIAALGNPNFAAAYLGICVPAAAWGALSTRWPTSWRIASGVTAGLCLVVAVLSRATQGPLAASAGLTVLAAAWLLGRPPGQRRNGLAALAAVVASGAALVVAGLAGAVPLGLADVGTRARQWYWEAALSMWRDNPVFGVGLEMYGAHWRAERPVEAARQLGDNFTDAAHSVPLHLLATGGALLAVAYLAFVGVVLVALLSGMRRLQGEERLLLGGLGGAWTAYQVQSLVSIDQVPLTVTQYVVAAGVVVVAGHNTLREVRLPGARPAARIPSGAGRADSRRNPAPARRRQATALDHVLTGVVAALALALAWLALVPLRANLAAYDGDIALARGDGAAAIDAYSRATDLLPGESAYWLREAQLFQRAQQPDRTREALQKAVDADPFSITAVRNAAELAEQDGDVKRAGELYDRALELDPRSQPTLTAVGAFLLRHGGADRAVEILERGVQVLPGSADLWGLLGRAYEAAGDETAALSAYERALEIEPEQPTAKVEIEKLRRDDS